MSLRSWNLDGLTQLWPVRELRTGVSVRLIAELVVTLELFTRAASPLRDPATTHPQLR